MSLFSKKGISKSRTSFEQIAQFVCLFYIALKNNVADLFSEEKILYASGLLTCIGYLAEGLINPNYIKQAVPLSSIGRVALFPKMVSHIEGNWILYEKGPNEHLVNFIMQLECIIFAYAHKKTKKYGAERIIDTVISNKKIIETTVDNMIAIGINHPSYNEYYKMTAEVLELNFCNIKSLISEYDSN